MPCSCRIPIEEYPDAQEWGPLLWRVLHGLAERAGRPVVAAYSKEERHHWLHFFKQVGEIIPCPTCKEHYNEYLRQNPVDALKTISAIEIHDWVRNWFWDLHEDVNQRLKKPAFPKEELEAAYKTMPVRSVIHTLDKPMMTAIHLSGTSMKKYLEWKKRCALLMSIMGI